jgi:hypothetical protein
MSSRMKRVILFTVSGTVVVSICVVMVFAYLGATTSITAEYSLHANTLVIDLVQDYVLAHEGAWPKSWADLENTPKLQWAMYEWPKDADEVRRYVTVDFEADPDKLATQSVEEFTAVQAIGPCFCHDPELRTLLDTIRETRCP